MEQRGEDRSVDHHADQPERGGVTDSRHRGDGAVLIGHAPRRRFEVGVGVVRLTSALAVIAILVLGFAFDWSAQAYNVFNYFGYFTNLTSLLAAAVLAVTAVRTLRGRAPSTSLTVLRAVATTCLLMVAIVYNVLVPGTGSAPVWVSVTLHAVFPALVFVDWVLVRDRTGLRWSQLWLVLPYPLTWLSVVLIRGATDGWVPYGFLLPEQGLGSLVLHVAGLAVALLVIGAIVWAVGRMPAGRTRCR